MQKITKEQIQILRILISGHNTIRYGVLQAEVHQTVENHTNRMLAIAPIIAMQEGLKFNNNELNAFILLHDLPELGMKHDITNIEQVEKQEAKQRKDEIEKQMIEMLADKYGAWLLNLFNEYNERKSDLTRFVKWVDKYEASRHMLEIDLFSEINLKNFNINTVQLIDAACKIPSLKKFTLNHLDTELRPIWERNGKNEEFFELRKKLQAE